MSQGWQQGGSRVRDCKDECRARGRTTMAIDNTSSCARVFVALHHVINSPRLVPPHLCAPLYS